MTENANLPRPPKPQLFSIFIWPEQNGVDQYVWRGQLKQLESGAIIYFSDWDDLIKQIKQQLPDPTENG
ncbi:MAG: hypothetical protein AAGD96_13690 [Chloroflexota bacterium]